jgi:hypothetical protein
VSCGLDAFADLSARLTGFSTAELAGTGMVETYFDTLVDVVGDDIASELLGAADRHSGHNMHDLLAHDRFGPLCRNIIVMWYLGQWDQLPADWRGAYGASTGDTSRVISAEAYREGLVWPTMGSHPQGAKQPGFGSWALPPNTASYGWSETQVSL